MYVPVPSLNTTKNSLSVPSHTSFTASYFSAVLLYVKSCVGASFLSAIYCLIVLSSSVTSIVPPSAPLAGTLFIGTNTENASPIFAYSFVPTSLIATTSDLVNYLL